MARCGRCGGSGMCQNAIHDRGDVRADVEVEQLGGPTYVCDECGQAPDEPGDCNRCGGTGEED